MRSRTRSAVSQPDRKFLILILSGLVAATVLSGITALTLAVNIAGMQ
jgi:hypothetical protein